MDTPLQFLYPKCMFLLYYMKYWNFFVLNDWEFSVIIVISQIREFPLLIESSPCFSLWWFTLFFTCWYLYLYLYFLGLPSYIHLFPSLITVFTFKPLLLSYSIKHYKYKHYQPIFIICTSLFRYKAFYATPYE